MRVGIAYLLAAWVGVQVASIALPALAAPAWVLRVLILVLALGWRAMPSAYLLLPARGWMSPLTART